MNKDTKLFFLHKVLYDVYFYGAIIVPFFVFKNYDISTALALAGVYMAVSITVELPTGIVGDRYGHKLSVISGVFMTGLALASFILISGILWDGLSIVTLAVGSALVSGSDTAILRSISRNFERDNRSFDYLKSVMLLLSFGTAGFLVEHLSFTFAVGLSSFIAFISIVPLLFLRQNNKTGAKYYVSFKDQLKDLPAAVRKVDGGFPLVLLGGMVAAVLFSVKEIVSTINPVYGVDISTIGVIAGLAMGGRIIGTFIEKRLLISSKVLMANFGIVVGLTTLIYLNVFVGILFILLSSVVAQMLFYKLKYQLSSQAPQAHIASLVSGLTLLGRVSSGALIFASGLLAGAGYFHLTFLFTALLLVFFGIPLVHKFSTSEIAK